MLKTFILLVVAALLLFGMIRYIEKRSIFFPTRKTLVTPQQIGFVFEDIYFTARDNTKLNGWFIPAENAAMTVLFCHGNAGNIGHRLEKIAMFHVIGANVFIFDYRGYGNSSGRPSENGVYLDVQAAYDYLASRKDVDASKIVGFGESLGGAVIIDLATKRKLAALIVDSTFTSACDVGRSVYPFIPAFVYASKFDSESKVKSLSLPKLFIHSINDEIIPFVLGKKLFDAAARPKDLLEITGGHNTAFIESHKIVLENIELFLQKIQQS